MVGADTGRRDAPTGFMGILIGFSGGFSMHSHTYSPIGFFAPELE